MQKIKVEKVYAVLSADILHKGHINILKIKTIWRCNCRITYR